jgi:hypothetical protein
MLITLATLAAVTFAVPQQGAGRGRGQGSGEGSGDTTVAVQQGARLDVNNFGGEIVVRTWNQNNVRVKASHSSRSRVDVSSSSSMVLVRTVGRRGPPSIVDLEITVPTWMAMSLQGTYTDISVENAGGAIAAESVQGDIEVSGGSGNVALKSVEGGVTLSKTRGRIEVNSVEGDIMILDAAGDITVESVDGDITLSGIDATNVEVNTVDGDIVYDGTIKNGGSYRFATHDGDITVVVPPGSNVSGSMSTFDGEFDPSFTVDTVRAGKHRITFTIGRSGGARLEIETFDGDIQLRRPGEVEIERPDASNRNKRHDENDDDHDDYSWSTRYSGRYAAAYAQAYAPVIAAAVSRNIKVKVAPVVIPKIRIRPSW